MARSSDVALHLKEVVNESDLVLPCGNANQMEVELGGEVDLNLWPIEARHGYFLNKSLPWIPK
jgi:hypothetical protein